MPRKRDHHERFSEKYAIDPVTGCWNWTGYKYHGYGILAVSRRPTKAHRISYAMHNGEIPRGMIICHTCDNRACVNPQHLVVGTYTDNNRDMLTKGRHWYAKRTSCENGHAFTEENTMMRTGGKARRCRVCYRDYHREYQRQRRASRKV